MKITVGILQLLSNAFLTGRSPKQSPLNAVETITKPTGEPEKALASCSIGEEIPQKCTTERLEQSENESAPRARSESGSCTYLITRHPLNAEGPISVMFGGRDSNSSTWHPSKQLAPIFLTLSGILLSFVLSFLHPAKTELPSVWMKYKIQSQLAPDSCIH